MLEFLWGGAGCRNVGAPEVHDRLQRGAHLLLLDVRSPEEYAEGHIPNSISLPLQKLKGDIAAVAPDKGAEIVVYCLSGMRADTACRQLRQMGYTNVANMGGIGAWRYGIEKGGR